MTKKPEWMKAERQDTIGLQGWTATIEGPDKSKNIVCWYMRQGDVKYLAHALGLKVVGDPKKSIKSGLIEFRRK